MVNRSADTKDAVELLQISRSVDSLIKGRYLL